MKGRMTTRRFAAATHVSASRRGLSHGPIDDALAAQGLSRNVRFVVPGFHAAMLTAAASDIVATVPLAVAVTAARLGLKILYLDLPLSTPDIAIAQAWHPRFDKDAGHRWLRHAVRTALTGHRATEREDCAAPIG